MTAQNCIDTFTRGLERDTRRPGFFVFTGRKGRVSFRLGLSGRDNSVRVHAVYSQTPRKGATTEFYQELKKAARKAQCGVRLSAEPIYGEWFEGPGPTAIVTWMKKLGFAVVHQTSRSSTEMSFNT